MFDAAVLAALRTDKEVTIRTSRQPDRGVVIWIVVVNNAVFVRSFRGPKGRWYVTAMADGRATLEVGRQLIPARVTPVGDARTVEAVSQAFLSKYASSPYAKAMVAPDILPTTLRLDPI